MMGEVIGMAAAVCKNHGTLPNKVYDTYLTELKDLMTKGTGKSGIQNNQKYNEGGTLMKISK
jgi:hypothetical protein